MFLHPIVFSSGDFLISKDGVDLSFVFLSYQLNALDNSPVSPETQLSSLYDGERSVGPVYSEWQWRPSHLGHAGVHCNP